MPTKKRIHSSYIESAIRIRKDFLSNIEHLKMKESVVSVLKGDMDDIVEDMKNIIGDNDDTMPDSIKKQLNEMLTDIERNIMKIQDEIRPLTDKIEDLASESKKLYNNIKDSYPLMDETEIKEQISEELVKLNLL